MISKRHTSILTLLLTAVAGMLLSLSGCKTKPEIRLTTHQHSVYIEIKGFVSNCNSTKNYTRKIYVAENGKQRRAETTVLTITRLRDRQITNTKHLTEFFANDTLQLFDSTDSTVCLATTSSVLSLTGIQPLDTDFWFLKELPALQQWEVYPSGNESRTSSKHHLNGYVYQFSPGLLLSIETENGNYYESATRILNDSALPASLFTIPEALRKVSAKQMNKVSNN